MILVVGVAVGIAVLVHGNQLPLDQNLDGFLERRLFDAGILNDFLVRGPAVFLTAGAADQIHRPSVIVRTIIMRAECSQERFEDGEA